MAPTLARFLFCRNLIVVSIGVFASFLFSSVSVASTDMQSTMDDTNKLPRSADTELEAIRGVKTYYGSAEVASDLHLRTLISIPIDSKRALHPILFTQWVSCESIELGQGDGGALGVIARNSGLALVRIERAGTGDSQGPDCEKLDYDTEVRHYVEAFTQILKNRLIDSSKVYILGESLGSTTAPLVALELQKAGFHIAGIAVQGGGALTHFERMLNFDRYYLERRPQAVPRETVHSEMLNRAQFHTEYLIKGRHPDAIAADGPGMKAVREDIRGMENNSHYGRPYAWHQQATQHNFLAAWAQIDAEVLVIFNEFDQFESLHGHKLIVDTVNEKRPETAKLIVQPGLGHSSWRFNSIDEAYRDETGIAETETTAAKIVHWLKTIR